MFTGRSPRHTPATTAGDAENKLHQPLSMVNGRSYSMENKLDKHKLRGRGR
jgi:hypothetical protein